MSVETALRDALVNSGAVSALVAARVYPMIMPQPPTLPAIVYQVITAQREQCLEGSTPMKRSRIQVDCWANSYAQVQALSDAARLAIEAATTFSAALDIEQDLYEAETKLFRRSADFALYFTD